MWRGRNAQQIDRQAGGGEVAHDRQVVVVDRAEPDRDVRIADVDDRVAGARIALGPAANRPARPRSAPGRRRGGTPRGCVRSRTGRPPRRWRSAPGRATVARTTGTRSRAAGSRGRGAPSGRQGRRAWSSAAGAATPCSRRSGVSRRPAHRHVAGHLELGRRPRGPGLLAVHVRRPRPSCPGRSGSRGSGSGRRARSDVARGPRRRRRSRSDRPRLGDVVDDGSQCGQVGVDIGDDSDSHARSFAMRDPMRAIPLRAPTFGTSGPSGGRDGHRCRQHAHATGHGARHLHAGRSRRRTSRRRDTGSR